MKEKFQKFMQGRYGADAFSQFLSYVALVLTILILIFGGSYSTTLIVIPLAIIIYSYFRAFSKNTYKRAGENQKFLNATAGIRQFFVRLKNHTIGTKTHKYFTCKQCKTELRVPKRKGKIKVRCPKCGAEYIKRT